MTNTVTSSNTFVSTLETQICPDDVFLSSDIDILLADIEHHILFESDTDKANEEFEALMDDLQIALSA